MFRPCLFGKVTPWMTRQTITENRDEFRGWFLHSKFEVLLHRDKGKQFRHYTNTARKINLKGQRKTWFWTPTRLFYYEEHSWLDSRRCPHVPQMNTKISSPSVQRPAYKQKECSKNGRTVVFLRCSSIKRSSITVAKTCLPLSWFPFAGKRLEP